MELLAVIALLAILMTIAVPNVISTINNNKKKTFLMDAERMVSKADYLKSKSKADREYIKTNGSKTYSFANLNEAGEFATDADGGSFDSSTYVRVTLSGGKYKYCVYVVGSRRKITSGSTCLDSESLTGISVVQDK